MRRWLAAAAEAWQRSAERSEGGLMLTFQIHQRSLRTEDPDQRDHAPAQVKAALDLGALAIGFTELGSRVDLAGIYRLCGESGYALYKGSNGDTAIAWDTHAALVGNGEVATGASRSLLWVTLDYRGEQVTVVEQHWVTSTYDKAHPGETRAAQTKAMIKAVTEHAQGHDVALWLGDTNANFANPRDTVRVALSNAGLVSAFEARKSYLPTLGDHVCDVVGHYAADSRVRCTDVKTFPKLESDHSPVSGFYVVARA
jgi:hypothetical protein